MQSPLANTVAKNAHSTRAQEQKPTAYVQFAKKTMTQIRLNVQKTDNNNKLCMKTVGSHHLDNRTMAYENYISIIEINLCGLSDRSRNAIDRYLDQCKPEVVHLTETEKKYSENTFTNYKTFNKISTNSTSSNFNQEWLIIR